jgi:hypothetical protein
MNLTSGKYKSKIHVFAQDYDSRTFKIFRLTSREFKLMANAISDLYPGENVCDYYDNKTKKKKLYFAYHTHRAPLLLNGLATPRRLNKCQKVSGKYENAPHPYLAAETNFDFSTTSDTSDDHDSLDTKEIEAADTTMKTTEQRKI